MLLLHHKSVTVVVSVNNLVLPLFPIHDYYNESYSSINHLTAWVTHVAYLLITKRDKFCCTFKHM